MSEYEEEAAPAALRMFYRGDHVELAAAMLEKISAEHQHDVVYDEGTIYRYFNHLGLWGPVDPDDASRIVQEFAGHPCKSPHSDRMLTLRVNAADIKGAFKLAQDRCQKHNFFADAPVGLMFSNGFVEVSADEIKIKKASRDNRARVGFTYPFDPNAKSPMFEAFLDSLFATDADKQEKIQFIQELFGISLVRRAYKYGKCAIFLGDGANGKDTLIDVLQSVFPPGTTSAIAPHRWGQEYYRAKLSGIWLNVIGELPAVELDASEAFKAIITGSEVDARHPHGRVFNFRPEAGHVFAANSNMGTPDFTHGFFRRFTVIRFNQRFAGKTRDGDIKDKLVATEKAAIVAWLLLGAQRLMRRGDYILPASHDVEIETWKHDADKVASFLEQKAFPSRNGKGTPEMTHYTAFREWLDANGFHRMSSNAFFRRARAHLLDQGFAIPHRNAAGIEYPVLVHGEGSVNLAPLKELRARSLQAKKSKEILKLVTKNV